MAVGLELVFSMSMIAWEDTLNFEDWEARTEAVRDAWPY